MKRMIMIMLLVFASGISHAFELPGTGLPGMEQPRPFRIADAELRLSPDSIAEVHFNLIADAKHHFYRDQIEVKVIAPENVVLEELVLPAGVNKYDPYLERELTLLKGTSSLVARLKLPNVELVKEQPLQISVRYQGCSEEACYPHRVERIELDFNEARILEGEPVGFGQTGPAKRYGIISLPAVIFVDTEGNEYAGERINKVISKQEMLERIARVVAGEGKRERVSIVEKLLSERGAVAALFAYFIFGLLMSLTPCVWPMIPITAGIVLGSKKPGTLGGAVLAGSYVTGMAASYAVMGLVVATLGSMVGSLLQHPAVLVLVSGLFVAMALSMFGLYEIPLISLSGNKRGGGILAAFGLGVASALVLSPCVGPMLAALLAFVALSGNQLLGTSMLFVYGLGTGLPLIALGAFSGTLRKLPKAGVWMLEIEKLFGIVMLIFAAYFLFPIVGYTTGGIVTGFGLAAATAVMLFFCLRASFKGGVAKMRIAVNAVLLAAGLYMGISALNGTSETIEWYDSFEDARTAAVHESKPMMIDFTADWCTTCKQIDRELFSDPDVIEASRNLVPLRLDETSAE